ncbi:MAG TPA: aminotransferase class V-fold PLP-dependent enzyme [Thermoanaerobaculia bacterium]|nr:aminotransferase class V-fold PLP-dependent enzyme [Thermoanaerobaculia bacterium]
MPDFATLMSFDLSPASLDKEFPVRRNLVYFNHAAQCPLPLRVAEAMEKQIENAKLRGAADWNRWISGVDQTREKAAAFIGAGKSEIAFVPSTGWGINLVAQAYDWKPGDNVVGDDMEFPANFYPWRMLEKRGVAYRLARNREGRISVDDIAAVVDARTRVVAVAWVAFHNGYVYPLEEIGAFCREREILLVVDAIQGVGALPIDVSEIGVDVLVADPHKWLLGPEACAIFYVSENARERLHPPFGGWWNLKTQGVYLDYSGELHLSARRYEPGSLPMPAIQGLSAALDLLTEVGSETIRDRILATNALLQKGLAPRGWRIVTPQPLASGILAAVPPSNDPRPVARKLEERSIIVTAREGAVRFSPHFYNDAAEVQRIFEAIDALSEV